jgi:ABC-type sugar transport system substrate-binding protein
VERLGVGETQRVKEITAGDIQGLILTPGNPSQLKPLIDMAEQRNIRVICVASDAPTSSRSSVVCVEPELNGRLAAELLSWLVPSGSQVAVITGMLHTEDHLKKTEGFSEAFPKYCHGGQVAEVIEGHEDHDFTFRKCLELLEKLPSMAGLYVNIGIALPVCSALNARQLSGKVRLIATDLSRDMVPLLKEGTITASIYQRPFMQGQYAVRLIVDRILAGRPIPATYYLNPNIITKVQPEHVSRDARTAGCGSRISHQVFCLPRNGSAPAVSRQARVSHHNLPSIKDGASSARSSGLEECWLCQWHVSWQCSVRDCLETKDTLPRSCARVPRRFRDTVTLTHSYWWRRPPSQHAAIEGGLVSSLDEGATQGGPLSPLLSIIELDEFDRELKQLGQLPARYVGNSNICRRSRRGKNE